MSTCICACMYMCISACRYMYKCMNVYVHVCRSASSKGGFQRHSLTYRHFVRFDNRNDVIHVDHIACVTMTSTSETCITPSLTHTHTHSHTHLPHTHSSHTLLTLHSHSHSHSPTAFSNDATDPSLMLSPSAGTSTVTFAST
jgi:hypothetical protein